ncbi:MAG TPA: TolC family protein, partial [Sandaracinaceae bacterium]
MRTERLLASLALVASGCVHSFRADLDRVEALTSRELPEEVLDAVDPVADARIERMLREPLTADAAVRIALANNREVRASLREIGVERGILLQANLLPNPEFEIDFRHQQDREQPLQIDLYVEYQLTHALLTPLRVAVASAELEAARYRAAARVLDVAYEARAAFYAAQAAEQQLGVAQRALEALAAARDAAQMLYDAGNLPELDLATHVAAYEEARATTALIELERADARERLARALGVHGPAAGFAIAGTLEAPPESDELPEAIERAALEASLELAEIRSRLEALGHRIGLTRTEGWLPDVSVDAHAEQDGRTWEIGGGARFSLPLFDRREGEAAAYEARFDALMERYLGTAVDVRSAAREARNRVISLRLRAVQYTNVIVPARQRVYEQTLLQYNAMQVGVFELVTALRMRLRAELEAAAALRDYWTARAALDAL